MNVRTIVYYLRENILPKNKLIFIVQSMESLFLNKFQLIYYNAKSSAKTEVVIILDYCVGSGI